MTLEELIDRALEEDIGGGDHTSLSVIPPGAAGKARLLIKEEGVLAGVDVARKVFIRKDPSILFTPFKKDGDPVQKGDTGFHIEGAAVSILACERLVLNLLQRMSGIATFTARIVERLKGLPVKVLDTRKTTPLLRELEKMAVRLGGGENHRMGLYDMIMIKDNHVDYAGGIAEAIRRVSRYQAVKGLKLKVEIEVRNLDELGEVLACGGVDRIMLDNFAPPMLAEAVMLVGGRCETEASGGITLENIREYAETGVDYISVGALTHHIRSLDMSLKAVT
jgi:nicotinate-nucleotide pyrophosphorylase (carboxylating)